MARAQGLTQARGSRGLLFIAALAGLAAAVLFVVAVNQDDSGTVSTGGGATVKAVVAAHSIAAGTEIKEGMIKIIDVPEGLLVPGVFGDTQPVVGEVTRVAISENDQITSSKIGPAVETGSGSFPYAIPAGKRAVSLEVREVTAVGGLLTPGNRVDVLGAFKIKGAPGLADNEYILSVRTILQNVLVLSVAQEHTEPLPVGAADGGTADSATNGQPPEDVKEQPGAATVTLALDPEDAQELISAQVTAESVWTSLRPAGETAPVDIPSHDVVVRE